MFKDPDGEETLRLFYAERPLLIVWGGADEGDPTLIATSVEGFRTRRYERIEKNETAKWNIGDAQPVDGAGARCSEVIVVAKTTRNPFAGIITVGRAKNNDIILAATSVSKVHAYLKQGESGQWTAEDKNSTNHTTLNTVQLEPSQERPLSIGDELVFGEVRCLFTDIEGLLGACSH